MSGGSYDYLYSRVEEAADALAGRNPTPTRRAFAAHLRLVAKAMHDIEWVDSCDYCDGDEDAAIRACIAPGAEVEQAAANLRAAIADAEKALASMKKD